MPKQIKTNELSVEILLKQETASCIIDKIEFDSLS